MKTNYKILEAHSGNSEAEIKKAKRLFINGVKKGKYINPGEIIIEFSDVNNEILASFVNAYNGEKLDTVRIN